MDWTIWIQAPAIVALNSIVLWIWKPWAAAYAGEKGKNLARKEDLDKILSEVRAVTIAQKEIEGKISGELWDRQWRLNQQREAYVTLIAALQAYGIALNERTSAVLGPPEEDSGPAVEKLNNAAIELSRARTVAELFWGANVEFAVDQIDREIDKVRERFDCWVEDGVSHSGSDASFWFPTDAQLSVLVNAARADLGMPTIEQHPEPRPGE